MVFFFFFCIFNLSQRNYRLSAIVSSVWINIIAKFIPQFDGDQRRAINITLCTYHLRNDRFNRGNHNRKLRLRLFSFNISSNHRLFGFFLFDLLLFYFPLLPFFRFISFRTTDWSHFIDKNSTRLCHYYRQSNDMLQEHCEFYQTLRLLLFFSFLLCLIQFNFVIFCHQFQFN